MHVAGNLVGDAAVARHVTQAHTFELHLIDHLTAELRCQHRIVVAGDPDPAPIFLHDVQNIEIVAADPV